MFRIDYPARNFVAFLNHFNAFSVIKYDQNCGWLEPILPEKVANDITHPNHSSLLLF